MSIDTYGLDTEQYRMFFQKNARLSAELYLEACNIFAGVGAGSMDFKTVLDLYQEAIYASSEDCRRYQKANNPEAIKDNDIFGLTPSREELMEEIKSVNAKVEALTDYVAELVKVTAQGLNGIAETFEDGTGLTELVD